MSFRQHRERLLSQYPQRPSNAPCPINVLLEEFEHAPSEPSRSDRDRLFISRSKKRTTTIGKKPSQYQQDSAMQLPPQAEASSTAPSAATQASEQPYTDIPLSSDLFYVPDNDIHYTFFDNLKAGVHRAYQAMIKWVTCTSTICELDDWNSQTGILLRERSVGHAYGESISRQAAGYETFRPTMGGRR
jgi:hypothetical protein